MYMVYGEEKFVFSLLRPLCVWVVTLRVLLQVRGVFVERAASAE